jgi:hypothetical protein
MEDARVLVDIARRLRLPAEAARPAAGRDATFL